jgi:ornithine cyclodeaminase/alanine dehydrogenase-like protein (mu-crystallin family)
LITLDARQTEAALPFPALIEALRAAFATGAEVPMRHHHALPDGATLLLMPAWQRAHVGVKIVTVHPGNAGRGQPAVHAIYLLSDVTTGAPLALLDGDMLTARRTAAASALASSYLARGDASRLLVVGAGRVASLLPEAHAAVRPIRTVEVWNRTPAGAERLAAALRARGFAASPVADLAAAVRRAEIVSCATLSREPLIEGDWLAPGAHLDLVGAYMPSMREADAAAVARAAVFADTEAALHECGELAGLRACDLRGTLATLCRGGPGRGRDDEITLFKSVGTALEDLAAAALAFGSRSGGGLASGIGQRW